MERLSRGATLVLTGRVEVLEARLLEPLPPSGAHSLADDGARIRIEAVEGTPEEPLIRVVQSRVSPHSRADAWVLHHSVPRFEFYLADPDRREALPLQGVATTVSVRTIVLPGVSSTLEEARLQPVPSARGPSASAADAGALRGTELRVVHWKPRGGFDIRSELRVRLEGAAR